MFLRGWLPCCKFGGLCFPLWVAVKVLIPCSSPTDEVATLGDLYLALRDSLLSHSRPLRLNALRLLACKLVKSSVGEQEVVKRCLQGEEVSLDIQGVRERLLRIGRVSQVVRDGDEISADLCARWLVGTPCVPADLRFPVADCVYLAQLKVNLRPLWSSAIEALASLSQRFGNVVWSLVFTELQTSSVNQDIDPSRTESGQAEDDIERDHREEERSWRDPSAHKLRSAVVKWLHGDRTQFLRVSVLSFLYCLINQSLCSIFRINIPKIVWINNHTPYSFSPH
jgi:U3 small nucleolar RNA-associated protein 20